MAEITRRNVVKTSVAGSAVAVIAAPFVINGFDNNVSKLLENLVSAFIKPGFLPSSLWVNDEEQWK